MALTNVELYEALRGQLGEEAARLIANVVPVAEDLATKSELREEVAGLRAEMHEGFAMVRTEIERSSKETMRWMLTFFVPLWLGTWGSLLAVVLKH